MLWYGSVASIPSGWTLCDGTMGTPDLVGLFVMGAKVFPAPGGTGGATTHNHAFTGDGHNHDLLSGNVIIDSTPAGDFSHDTNTAPAVGDTDTAYNWPPYHALCYIMKLPIP